MSYSRLIYHIVFRTYCGKATLPEDGKRIIFSYIHQLCLSNKWNLIRINGFQNHVHILLSLPSDIDVASAVQKIKGSTSHAFKKSINFPMFEGWNKGYAAFSVGYREVEIIKQYIINQEEHHKKVSWKEELEAILAANGVKESQYEEL